MAGLLRGYLGLLHGIVLRQHLRPGLRRPLVICKATIGYYKATIVIKALIHIGVIPRRHRRPWLHRPLVIYKATMRLL